MNFPDEDLLLEIIEQGLAQDGGPFEIQDKGGISAAIARGHNKYLYELEDDALSVAVAVGYSIFRHRHPLVDGNKRAGFIALNTILAANGLGLDIDSLGRAEIERLIKSAAAGSIPEHELASIMRPHLYSLHRQN